MSRHSLILTWTVLILAASTLNAQRFFLDEPLHTAGDTLRGVGYMREEGLTGYAYFLGLFDNEGELVINKLLWVEKQQFSFSLPLPADLETGSYILQLTNYQNMAITQARALPIIGPSGDIDPLLGPGTKNAEIKVPEPQYFEIASEPQPSGQMKVSIRPLIDQGEVANVAVTVYDLGQNPTSNLDDRGECQGVSPHSMATRGLNQWLTTFHLEGWLMSGDQPLVGETIALAQPEDVMELRATTTNETGKFGFYNVDFDGNEELFLSPLNADLADYQLLLSDSRVAALQAAQCVSSIDWTREQLQGWIARRELQKKVVRYYLPQVPERRQISLPNPRPLFDDADHTILLDDYIPMASVREMFREVVPYVHLSKKRIRVFSSERRRTYEGYPLLLINGVPVARDSIVLGLDPSLIHSVQVLNTADNLAPMGRVGSSGVVSVVTRDPSFRPLGTNPVEVEGFYEMPDLEIQNRAQGVPYFPSVLYWQAQEKLGPKGCEFSFEVPAYETDCQIEVTVQLNNGEVITGRETVKITRRAR